MAIDSPESRSEILKLAAEYLENDNPGKAIKLLENTEIPEGDTELQHRLAVAYADRKWGRKAIAQYRKCLESDRIYPELIQDYTEFMLDSEEHGSVTESLCELLERKNISAENSAMCVAMIYAVLGDCIHSGISTELSADFLKTYIAKNPEAADKTFFAAVMKNLSLTPNDISVISVTNHLLRIMADAVPSVLNDSAFQSAVADFEISLVLFSETVNCLTVLGMRTAKLKFASAADDRDYLRYLVFDAKMSVIDNLRMSGAGIDTERFSAVFPYLWSLTEKFVTGALKTPDLKKFTRDEIYSELKNASPRLLGIFEKNLSADGFAALKTFISSPVSAPKPAVFSDSRPINRPSKPAKTEPNAPCPCGSGKKFKKCCGLIVNDK